MKGLNVRLFANLFLVAMLSAFSAMTANALTISGSNVGIGTDTPDHPLDVVGNINASSYTGSGTGLTDINGDHITSGTILESLIDASICRDSELTSAISTHDADLSAHGGRFGAPEAVAAIKNADGSGSGLDADLLDGQHASDFASSTHNHVISFAKVTGPSLYFSDKTEPYPEVSWYSNVSIQFDGPGTLIADYGATGSCESSGGLTSIVRVFPTLDGLPVAGDEALLSTQSSISASFAEAGQLAIPAGTHTLGLGARGRTFNITSPGCFLYSLWIKAIPQ